MFVAHEPEHTTWIKEDVVIQLIGKGRPETKRMVVQGHALVAEVIGADDRRIPDGIAATKPAALNDRDVGETVVLGEVVRRREAVKPTAHDHDVVGTPGRGIAPEKGGMAGGRFLRLAQRPPPRFSDSGILVGTGRP